MRNIGIIGAGDLGKQIAHVAKNNDICVTCFFDDYAIPGSDIEGIPIVGKLEDVWKSNLFDELIIAIGYKHFNERKYIFDNLSKKFKIATIIDKSAIIDPSAYIGTGVCIMPGCIIGQNVKINNNVFLNIGASIAHDSQIGSNSFIAPNVAIAGFTTIGENSFIGINATIIDNLKIGDNVLIGGSAVIIKDILTEGLYVGNPAKKVK